MPIKDQLTKAVDGMDHPRDHPKEGMDLHI